MEYFKLCKSVEEAHKRYRELLMQYHLYHAWQDGEAVTKEIITQFNDLINSLMSNSLNSYFEDKDWQPDTEAFTPFQDILQKIINFECEIEIIGFWIYCFNSYEVREELRSLGFWFTYKHDAWVYSGKPKLNITSKRTLDEIRAAKGSQKVKKENEKYPLKFAV